MFRSALFALILGFSSFAFAAETAPASQSTSTPASSQAAKGRITQSAHNPGVPAGEIYDPAASQPFGSLEDVTKEMMSLDPKANPARQYELLNALDAFVCHGEYEADPRTVKHYRTMADHAISQIENEKGETPGVKVWKFYSSSFVCRSGHTTFSFDLNIEPNSRFWTPDPKNPNWKEPEKTDKTFVLTDEQIERLAKVVDVAFYTHEDTDHINYATMSRLAKNGKIIVVTAPVAKLSGYKDIADKLTVLTPELGKTYTYGDLKVQAIPTQQTHPNRAGVADNIYLVTTPTGVVVMDKGDANVPADAAPFLEKYHQEGGKVDLYLGPVGFGKADNFNLTKKIHEWFDDFIIPGHEYEWVHRLSWNQLMSYGKMQQIIRERIDAGRGMVLSWGQSYHYLPGDKVPATNKTKS